MESALSLRIGVASIFAIGVLIGMPLGTLVTPYVVKDFAQWCADRR